MRRLSFQVENPLVRNLLTLQSSWPISFIDVCLQDFRYLPTSTPERHRRARPTIKTTFDETANGLLLTASSLSPLTPLEDQEASIMLENYSRLEDVANHDGVTVHEFLMSNHTTELPRLKYAKLLPSGQRFPRKNELAVPHPLEEVYLIPGLGDELHRLVSEAGPDPKTVVLDTTVKEKVRAGPLIAKNVKTIMGEKDVEYIVRTATLDPIATIINEVEARQGSQELFVGQGRASFTQTLKDGHHAIPDLEIANIPAELKQINSVHAETLHLFLHLPDLGALDDLMDMLSKNEGQGFCFPARHPKDDDSSSTQPFLQIFTQMQEKQKHFGVISSHHFMILVARLEKYPSHLYLSRLYESGPPSSPQQSIAYTLYAFYRVACSDDLAKKFQRWLTAGHQTGYRDFDAPTTLPGSIVSGGYFKAFNRPKAVHYPGVLIDLQRLPRTREQPRAHFVRGAASNPGYARWNDSSMQDDSSVQDEDVSMYQP